MPALPNSVEEAYRQKCIELKKRLKDCESSNGLLVVRNHRLRRGIQRLRLERALLLREIERRIDPRADDSDGTPSPPPTPLEKPLRIKRSKRDGMGLGGPDSPYSQGAGDGYNGENNYAQNNVSRSTRRADQKPRNAFTIFCEEQRDPMMQKNADDIEFDVSRELSKAWHELPEKDRKPYYDEAEEERLHHQRIRYESRMQTQRMAERERERAKALAELQRGETSGDGGRETNATAKGAEAADPMAVEEDYPSYNEREDTPSRGSGGFTAVNSMRPNFL